MMDHPEDRVDTTNANTTSADTVWGSVGVPVDHSFVEVRAPADSRLSSMETSTTDVRDLPLVEVPNDPDSALLSSELLNTDETDVSFVRTSDDCESPGPISLFNTISLQLKSYVPHTKPSGSVESNIPLRPRARLLCAGLLAFVAWGIAMAVLWQNIHMESYPEPTDAVVRVLDTLTSEAERLRERLHAPWQSYRFPMETPMKPRTPESWFGPDEMAFLDSYIAAHPVELSPPSDVTVGESLPGLPQLPGAPDPREDSDQEGSVQGDAAEESLEPSKTGPEQMSEESKRLVEEMMRYRLEGNMELTRALSRYPNDSEAMLTVANYLHYFSQPMEASRAGQLALDLLKPDPQNSELPTTSVGNERSIAQKSARGNLTDGVTTGGNLTNENSVDGVTTKANLPSVNLPSEATVAGGTATNGDSDSTSEDVTDSGAIDQDSNSLLRNQIWILLGNISMETDQPKTAVTLFQQSCRMERAVRGEATDSTLLLLVESQLAANDPAGARESLGSLLADHPCSLAALTLRGQTWFQDGNWPAAKEDFRTVTELAPDRTETMVAWLGLALCAAHQDDTAAVATALTTLRRLREQASLPAYEPPSDDLEESVIPRTPPTEVVCREELRQIRKKLAVVFVQLAALYARNELLQTDRLLRRAVEIDDHCESAYLLTSAIFARQLLMEEAIQTLLTGNRRMESGVLAFELAGLYRQQGYVDEAGIWLQRATERSPRTARYHAALAAWYLDRLKTLPARPRQMVDAAILQATTAVELDPTAPHYMILAATFAAAGDTQSARTTVMKAIELEPGNAEYGEFLVELTKTR